MLLLNICFALLIAMQFLNEPFRLGAHWQLKSCSNETVAVNVSAVATKKLLVPATFFFQYRMDFMETACVCALLLRIRNG
jgi:hypothetical protein